MATSAQRLKASDLKPFDLAAAGHDGVLSDESGALVIKPCTAREVSFYESVAVHPELAKWVPTFFGTLELSNSVPDGTTPSSNRNKSIVLQNTTHGFIKPCVLDIKLGAQLWDNDAPQEKRDRLDAVSEKTTSKSLGMRIAGMKVWKRATEGSEVKGYYKVYDKSYGRTYTAETVIEAMREYFDSDISKSQMQLLAKRFKKEVAEIQAVLEGIESRMYSASLLFVYEGDGAALDEALKEEEENAKKPPKTQEELDQEEEDEVETKEKKIEVVKLIDFAHATLTPGEGPDENALQGVRSSVKLLAELAGK
ncbi:inositol polyphosphate kinase-domain-containing protein [Morchella snyderi]|nr:inositol polyphosphate kinase-domain-containing protein [Morchella snyderi]